MNLAVKTPNDCVPVYLFNATKLKRNKHNKAIKVSCPSAFYGQSLSVHLLISRLFTAGYFAFFVDAHFHELRHPPANNAACEWLICPVLTSTRLSQNRRRFLWHWEQQKKCNKKPETGNATYPTWETCHSDLLSGPSTKLTDSKSPSPTRITRLGVKWLAPYASVGC